MCINTYISDFSVNHSVDSFIITLIQCVRRALNDYILLRREFLLLFAFLFEFFSMTNSCVGYGLASTSNCSLFFLYNYRWSVVQLNIAQFLDDIRLYLVTVHRAWWYYYRLNSSDTLCFDCTFTASLRVRWVSMCSFQMSSWHLVRAVAIDRVKSVRAVWMYLGSID